VIKLLEVPTVNLNRTCPHRFMQSRLGPQLVVLFWKVVETLGGGVSLEEAGHLECDFEGYTQSLDLPAFCFLTTMR
jgi:hypothetical protein